ncbi:MAG: excinuclease ABC subunit UvrC [Pseudomonadales bacterium]|nr:excinuclease ABC subunit UvrC [Pseudomonadales bacterium]
MRKLETVRLDPKRFLANLTSKPGIYQMLDSQGRVLYVGKARNLKKRVGSYFRASGLNTKTMVMIDKIVDIQVTITSSETEALLLEQNLIKTLRPAYNIQLRDDKSYPYILLSEGTDYPRLVFYRGSRKQAGRFFGPYPSTHATRETLQILQKVFRVRQCEDSYFKNRSRPCLQYQIGRCTAPCVGLITKKDYARDVHYSTLFLKGKSDRLTKELTNRMESASATENFEKAALVRNQIIDLRRIQEQQYVTNQGEDADVIAGELRQTYACIHVINVRAGRIIGSKSFYPRYRLATSQKDLLEAFVSQSYLREGHSSSIPKEIIIPSVLKGAEELQNALSYVAGRKIKLSMRVRGHRAKWVKLAITNARESLEAHIANKQNTQKQFMLLQDTLELDSQPSRVECFDISHTAGEVTVASCVVFDENGPIKSHYRRFNIKGVKSGDDYGAMEQVLDRRFTRLSKGEGKLPDIVLLDGGKGQLKQAEKVMQKFQLPEIQLLAIAKGISRRAGQETLFLSKSGEHHEIALPPRSPALHLLQQIRDEAHRFALTGHRQRRGKTRKQSTLEQVPGLGPKRRRELVKYFGGQQEIKKASEEEIAKVKGINKKLAEDIYTYLHNQ